MSDPPQHPVTVAVIEDEARIRRFVRSALEADGYRVREAGDAHSGRRVLEQDTPDLAIVDLGLPDRDGLELIRELRRWSAMPVIILSARDQESEKIKALDAGADDYLTKPFGVGELLARMRVALRHRATVADDPLSERYTCGPVVVDLAARRVTRDGEPVALTRHEFGLLEVLVRNAGKVLTHRMLLREVWGPHAQQETHYVRVYIASLRKKLEAEPSRPKLIVTEQGVGYRLAENE